MFNHLIESNSHRKEFKRRGSFIIYTTALYALVIAITGVVSVYAFDAQLGDQSYEISWLEPVNLAPIETATNTTPARTRENSTNSHSTSPERVAPMLSVNHPEVAPTGVSVTPNRNLPIPEGGQYKIGPRDTNPAVQPGGPSGTGIGSTGNGRATQIVIEAGDPPPTPVPPPVKKVITSKRVLNSEALALPKPYYSSLAKQLRLQGTVAVQVLIDERGNVVSAKAISGHPVLIPEAQKAALQARFSPTMIGDTPVKVSGVITYNFVLQ